MRPLALLCLVLAACGPRLIPNTEIVDTPDTRAVMDVIGRYRAAVESRNADGVLALLSHSYFDKNLDYNTLAAQLPKKFATVKLDKLDLEVRTVTVKGDEALADIYYVEHYMLALPSGEQWQQRSDDSRITFHRESGVWKIVAGL